RPATGAHVALASDGDSRAIVRAHGNLRLDPARAQDGAGSAADRTGAAPPDASGAVAGGAALRHLDVVGPGCAGIGLTQRDLDGLLDVRAALRPEVAHRRAPAPRAASSGRGGAAPAEERLEEVGEARGILEVEGAIASASSGTRARRRSGARAR